MPLPESLLTDLVLYFENADRQSNEKSSDEASDEDDAGVQGRIVRQIARKAGITDDEPCEAIAEVNERSIRCGFRRWRVQKAAEQEHAPFNHSG